MLSVLVMTKAGVYAVPFGRRRELVLGRTPECDVWIDDKRVSRRHARLTYDGERARIVDLGSVNGTSVGHVRLSPDAAHDVSPGDVITLGSAVVVLHDAEAPTRGRVWSSAELGARIEAEQERARRQPPGFALASVRVRPRVLEKGVSTCRGGALDGGAAQALEAVFAEALRASDVVASVGAGRYSILLARSAPDAAERVVEALHHALDARALVADVGVAFWPRDGETREDLEAVAASVSGPRSRREPTRVEGGAMARLAPTIDRIAAGTISVLVLGETGVGKDVLARTIHARSPRAAAPLVCINCGALTESLLEAELFGFERGAFTGAAHTKPGLVEAADGGTVFLDEVGEMPASLQVKLLRVLEQREVLRVGAVKARPVDVRFLAATHRDLEEDVAAGRFRRDLYYRLNGMVISLPPLRERRDEIEPLARLFVRQAAEAAGRTTSPTLTPQAIALLERYAWPGNVRELRNTIERAVLLCPGELITLDELPVEAMAAPRTPGPPAAPPSPRDPAAARAPSPAPRDGGEERARTVAALERCAGNQTQAAKLLGISRRALITRLDQMNLPRPRKARDASGRGSA